MGYIEDGQPILTQFDDKLYLPSAVFFDEDLLEAAFGTDGLERYLEGNEGRMIWSPKNALGTSLMHEKTAIFGQPMSFAAIIARVVGYMLEICRTQAGADAFDRVVCGRPVRFHDTDDELDAEAEALLRGVLEDLGFQEIEFVFEPIAASIAYASELDGERLGLIVDMGGGTSDFTVARLYPGGGDVLAVGGVHVAGTTFDAHLSLGAVMPELGLGMDYRSMTGKVLPVPTRIFHQLSNWHRIHRAYAPDSIQFALDVDFGSLDKLRSGRLVDLLDARYGHALAKLVERSKIELSASFVSTLTTYGLDDDFSVELAREMLEEAITHDTLRIRSAAELTIENSGVAGGDIDVVFMTGGSSRVPIIRQHIREVAPQATILDGDTFGSVARGLTLMSA